jgi:hypothetical protein
MDPEELISRSAPDEDRLEELESYFEAFDKEPDTTLLVELRRLGVQVRPPNELQDLELDVELRRIAFALAELHVFLESTDHLNDRRLYEEIWEQINSPTIFISDPDTNCHIDLAGTGSEEDIETYLRYYADEAERKHWVESFPLEALPPAEIPLYGRPWMPRAGRC